MCEYPGESSREKTLPPHVGPRKLLPQTSKYSQAKPPTPDGVLVTAVAGVPRRTQVSSSSTSLIDLTPWPSRNLFKNEKDYSFHTYFHTEVANELAAFCPSTLWQKSILQLAESQPFIREAVIAVAAMYRVPRQTRNVRMPVTILRGAYREEHTFALEKYQKSVTLMKDAIARESMDVRTALIACLLTVCFEQAFGRRDLALANLRSGRLLDLSTYDRPLIRNYCRDISYIMSQTQRASFNFDIC